MFMPLNMLFSRITRTITTLLERVSERDWLNQGEESSGEIVWNPYVGKRTQSVPLLPLNIIESRLTQVQTASLGRFL